MTNVDLGKTSITAAQSNKIFGTVDAAVDFFEAIDASKGLKRKLSALQRGPFRFYRDNLIGGEEGDYIFFVVSGVIRSCKTYQEGARGIVAFYLPVICLAGPI